MAERIDTAIVGGGQAGLALSYHLRQSGREHVVLERAPQPAEAWRNQRWDSFTLVTPNWQFRLPGATYDGNEPDAFLPRDDVVARLERYAAICAGPIRYGVTVTSVEQSAGAFQVRSEQAEWLANNVVVATGLFQRPRFPAFATDVSHRIAQVHSSAYRRPDALPPGAVLVVGTAQSGCQIAEELYQSGRHVYLSVGKAKRLPRRYRGRDITDWLDRAGFYERTVDQLPSPAAKFDGNPHVSGRGGGRTLNLHRFASDGVTLLGRVESVQEGMGYVAPDLHANLAAADRFEAEVCRSVDGFIERQAIPAAVEELPVLINGFTQPTLDRLHLTEAGITSVVWATGFGFDFTWVRPALLDSDGYPVQRRGVTDIPGLYFLGLHWLHTIKSGLFFGVGDDAAHIAASIDAQR